MAVRAATCLLRWGTWIRYLAAAAGQRCHRCDGLRRRRPPRASCAARRQSSSRCAIVEQRTSVCCSRRSSSALRASTSHLRGSRGRADGARDAPRAGGAPACCEPARRIAAASRPMRPGHGSEVRDHLRRRPKAAVGRGARCQRRVVLELFGGSGHCRGPAPGAVCPQQTFSGRLWGATCVWTSRERAQADCSAALSPQCTQGPPARHGRERSAAAAPRPARGHRLSVTS
ncbi:unnamed protein product [Prorocentrum cordatum]|uniref:Uncharacterized protein n=1 Tax=Prorocentrum cordatum TaxID=2364126 RepID=A0ABN9Q0K0_9DINO|nr:unnamed protein product [Polarella glacialis]